MRPLIRRTLIASIGAPLILVIASAGHQPLIALVVALQCFLLWEWTRVAHARALRIAPAVLFILVLAIDAAMIEQWLSLACASLALATVIYLLSGLWHLRSETPVSLGVGLLYVVYAAFPLALWIRISSFHLDAWEPAGALVVLLISTWMCDMAAYGIGQSVGKRKLWESVSPNKTVEGAIGGLVASSAALPIMSLLRIVSPRPFDFLAIPIVVGVIGQLGDLFESRLKRDIKVKDSSGLLLSHGGFFDRFDSLLLSTPAFYFYLQASTF